MNIKASYEKHLPEDIKGAIELLSRCADDFKIYLIGGAVRDIIMGNGCFDIDIAVEADAVEFVEDLEKKNNNIKIKSKHADFGSVKILVNGLEFDIASTRKECYPTPACLPRVTKIACNLAEDVIRRDFSINSIAMSLNKKNFGEVIDYTNGIEDIKAKKIRILHEKSFIDDPTRIIRALKFKTRFGFRLEDSTEKLQAECIESKMFDNLGTERLKAELQQTFNLNSQVAFDAFIENKFYRLISNKIIPKKYETISTIINKNEQFLDDIWLVYMAILLNSLEPKEIRQCCEKLNLSAREVKNILDCKTNINTEKLDTNFEMYETFKPLNAETLVTIAILNKKLVEKINLYLHKLKNTKIFLNGDDLLSMGIGEGKQLGNVLKLLLKEKINGNIHTKEDEVCFLQQLNNEVDYRTNKL